MQNDQTITILQTLCYKFLLDNERVHSLWMSNTVWCKWQAQDRFHDF